MNTTGMDMAARMDAEHRAAFEAVPARALDESDVPGTVAAIRAAGLARQQAAAAPLPASVVIEDREVPGHGGEPPVRVRLYRRLGLAAGAPGFLWIHGGGMIGGTVESTDAYCARIAEEAGAVVASVDYRLAPEHPYPAPLEDCYSALHWFASAAADLGVERSRIAIGGASAGAGLAAGLALLARDRGQITVGYQHLVYPMLDDRNITASSHAVLDTRVWCRASNIVGWSAYLGGRAGEPGVEAYAAPARATDLTGLPPAYICVGSLDLFLDEDIAYARALLEAGVPAELHVYPGAFHGSVNTVPHSPLSRRWRDDEVASIRRALGT
ncbi:MAG: esterase [Chloroflexota bacterium]